LKNVGHVKFKGPAYEKASNRGATILGNPEVQVRVGKAPKRVRISSSIGSQYRKRESDVRGQGHRWKKDTKYLTGELSLNLSAFNSNSLRQGKFTP